ncbi:glucose-inhibited division protein B [Halomonas salipaludis]|uniref:Glucose-inhibited division protein B n=2 Tax=Halomonas salipaludis TaxID=2032625 RepID=A0A2A2F2M4_9GAMM|nr:glucose-inhibited division protein B [Halomonas salipaludis]
MRLTLSSPLAAVLLVVLFLSGCGSDSDSQVPLYVLASEGDAYDGERVVTQGVVRRFEDPLHYWIEDQDLNRVELFPHDAVAEHLGEQVQVSGTFRLDERGGRRLTVTRLEALGE